MPLAEGERSYFPFCSERCQQIDLLRWSKGQYAIVEPLSDDEIQEITGGTVPEEDEGEEG